MDRCNYILYYKIGFQPNMLISMLLVTWQFRDNRFGRAKMPEKDLGFVGQEPLYC